MIVKVEPTWDGQGHRFRLTFCVNGQWSRESFVAENEFHWTREDATYAKNLISELYHVDRNKIRFDHY